jgi:hypothetical protein
MQGLVNDFVRYFIAVGIRLVGLVLNQAQRVRIIRFRRGQLILKRRYGIDAETPILPYGPQLEGLIAKKAKALGSKAMFATTSGSTGKPKRLLYSTKRLKTLSQTYSEVFCRMCWSLSLKRTSLYVFSAFKEDESLTAMMLAETRLPSYLTTLQAPYRVQCAEAIKSLVDEYGSSAVRLWQLTLSNPGVLYATNPSTIVAFLDEVDRDWQRVSQLVRDWRHRPHSFNSRLHKIAGRIESGGSAQRLSQIDGSDSPLELEVWAPGVKAYICWTGGYVKPFLDRLSHYLPASKYQLVPMYSMSTETVETVSHFHGSQVAFLPLGPGVVYEFIEEGHSDLPEHLLRADQVRAGSNYTMVVSDAFGLRRYQTNDLFRCEGMKAGLPNLTFLRRRDLEYSFTGEKLTAEQLCIVYEELKSETALGNSFLTCVPCIGQVPHYNIYAVGTYELAPGLSEKIDERLCELNAEYRNKRASGRLGSVRFGQMRLEEFVRRTPSAGTTWETQFKFLPLYREPWR